MNTDDKPIQVLLIEDDPEFAQVMKMRLVSVAKTRFYVEHMDQLNAGLKRLSQGGVDVVLLDLDLKDSRGIETLVRLHAHIQSIPIVVLTGAYDEVLATEALKLGAQDYLVKGRFDHEMLVRTIRYAIERMRQEEELKGILTAITSILIGLDSENLITHWNHVAEKVLGISQIQVLQKPFQKCGLEWDWNRMMAAVSECRASDQPVRVDDLVFKRLDGSGGFIGLTINPVKSPSGKPGSVLIFGADITERKQTQEALKKANEELVEKQRKLEITIHELERAHTDLKTAQAELISRAKAQVVSDLAAGVAHEVKNPLAILMQAVDFLDQRVRKDDATVASVLEQMGQAISRADNIVRNLLDLSRPERLEVVSENLNSIIENALQLIKTYLDRSHVQVVRQLASELPSVKIDRGKITGVFINLFSNAIEAMPSGGQLLIKTETKRLSAEDIRAMSGNERWFRHGQEVAVVHVQDTGSGIPQDMLPSRIFEPFFTTKRGRGGTGLGLSVVRNILEMHKAGVEIRNRKDREGAEATLTFPI